MFNWFEKTVAINHSEEPQKANCPYCSGELEKFPTRKQACGLCGKEFVVRTHYLTKKKIILTEEDATKYDLEKEKYYLDKSLIDNLKLNIGVNKNDLDKLVEKTREELTEKFGQPAKFGDVVWGVANKMTLEAMKKGDLGLLQFIQFEMALYLHCSGKDGSSLRKSSFEIELRGYKKSGVIKGVIIRNVDQGCNQCKTLNGKKLSIDEAIMQKLLPCKDCTYKMSSRAASGWCRCCYSPEVEL